MRGLHRSIALKMSAFFVPGGDVDCSDFDQRCAARSCLSFGRRAAKGGCCEDTRSRCLHSGGRCALLLLTTSPVLTPAVGQSVAWGLGLVAQIGLGGAAGLTNCLHFCLQAVNQTHLMVPLHTCFLGQSRQCTLNLILKSCWSRVLPTVCVEKGWILCVACTWRNTRFLMNKISNFKSYILGYLTLRTLISLFYGIK